MFLALWRSGRPFGVLPFASRFGCKSFWVGRLISSSVIGKFSCLAIIFALSATMAGCARGIPDPGLDVDGSLKTSSVTPTENAASTLLPGLDKDALRDGETIAHAVSSVQFTGSPIAWENPATGSNGDITNVIEQRLQNGALCREFNALRTSYDGIRNYGGEICMNDAGIWRLTALNPL